jgi:hypothetical protein
MAGSRESEADGAQEQATSAPAQAEAKSAGSAAQPEGEDEREPISRPQKKLGRPPSGAGAAAAGGGSGRAAPGSAEDNLLSRLRQQHGGGRLECAAAPDSAQHEGAQPLGSGTADIAQPAEAQSLDLSAVGRARGGLLGAPAAAEEGGEALVPASTAALERIAEAEAAEDGQPGGAAAADAGMDDSANGAPFPSCTLESSLLLEGNPDRAWQRVLWLAAERPMTSTDAHLRAGGVRRAGQAWRRGGSGSALARGQGERPCGARVGAHAVAALHRGQQRALAARGR